MKSEQHCSKQIGLAECFSNTIQLYVKIWKFNKSYLLISFPMTLVKAIQPFISLVFIKIVLDLFSEGKTATVIIYTVTMCIANFVLRWCLDIYKKYDESQIEIIKANFHQELEEITMAIPYEMLQDASIMEDREKALEIFRPTQAAYMDMRNSIMVLKTLLSLVLQLAGLIAILLTLEWYMVVGLLAATVISIIIDAIAANKEFQVWDISLVHFGRKVGYLQSISIDIEYAKELRNYCLADWVTKKMKDLSRVTMKEIKTNVLHFSLTAVISNTVMILVNGLIYVYIGAKALEGYLPLSNIVVYLNSITLIVSVLSGISYCVLLLYKSGLFTRSYLKYLKYGPCPESPNTIGERLKNPDAEHTIIFEDVWFKYPGQDDYTLKNVNISIFAHKTTAIVGDNGAGKTTLIKLILRLYTPQRGRIFLDGIDINSINRYVYYQFVTAVFQDFDVLDFSLQENLCFDKDYSPQTVSNVLHKLSMEAMIDNLPNGFHTVLGIMFDEAGVELSGGQQQKVAIARALIKQSSIVILDEPTAMLSPEVENKIYQNMNILTNGKTAIYISHRMSSCKFCDNILVMLHGSIVEQGSHIQLMQNMGIYYKMFKIQANFYNDLQPEQ